MQYIIATIALLVVAVSASPLPEDNWQLIPDSDGALHMVDLNSYDADIEPAFNAWNQVRFLLFTNRNPHNGQHIVLNNAAQLAASNFDANRQTRFIIHGWNSGPNGGVNTQNTAAYLSRGDFNVFVVDWSIGAGTANYPLAVSFVPEVGRVVASFVNFLVSHRVPFSAITLVGHSLGAHIAGIAGKNVINGRIASIVGMDPAFPLFNVNNPAGRIHITDAIYVEIIHTNIGRMGFDVPLGDASFYPNWGRLMPGCHGDLADSCSHSLAWAFMAESIRLPGSFFGTRCSGWPAIQAQQCPSTGPSHAMGGEPANNGASGVFFLQTNSASPFGQGWRS